MKKIICISERCDGVDFARLVTNELAAAGALYTCGGFISEMDATVSDELSLRFLLKVRHIFLRKYLLPPLSFLPKLHTLYLSFQCFFLYKEDTLYFPPVLL